MRTFLIALLLIPFTITPCVAKIHGTHGTPDARTPHDENACVGETGVALGLCNAYCEAMDCDYDYSHASEKACSRIRNLFRKHTDGRDLPCEYDPEKSSGQPIKQPRCPCLDDIPEFAAFLENPADFSYCYNTGTGGLLVIGDIANVEIITNGMDEIPICAYSNDDIFHSVEITYEELDICEKLLLEALVNADLYCK